MRHKTAGLENAGLENAGNENIWNTMYQIARTDKARGNIAAVSSDERMVV